MHSNCVKIERTNQSQSVAIEDKNYPKLLKEIGSDAPKKIYYKGNWPPADARGKDNIFENCLAVVGSRRLTSYGRRITEQLVSEIASAGVTIVSGFMYGGDEAAHKAAVLAGGKTIAVMPCGINLIHPENQKELYNKILEKDGLIISEIEGDSKPLNWTYARRNRIVAGLSKAVLVVEAALASGTLITANFARKFKRKIFAVPGPITSEVSKGTFRLIKEGAEPVCEAGDVLGFYKVLANPQAKRAPSSHESFRVSSGLTPTAGLEQKIIEQLRREPMEADQIARALCLPVAEIGTSLSLLQLKSLVSQDSGKYYLN